MEMYLATVIITAVASCAVTAVIVERLVRLIQRQIKLNHSINLVKLKTQKLVYWIFAAVLGVLIFYTVMQMADAEAPCVADFKALFGVGRLQTNIALMFVLIVMIAAEAFIVTLALGKSAVVDKGVYTNFDMLDWHQVRNYIIDEQRCVLVLTTDRLTFSTLRHVSTPFRIAKSDIQKLKFILDKNKNKFDEFDSTLAS